MAELTHLARISRTRAQVRTNRFYADTDLASNRLPALRPHATTLSQSASAPPPRRQSVRRPRPKFSVEQSVWAGRRRGGYDLLETAEALRCVRARARVGRMFVNERVVVVVVVQPP